MLNGYNGLLGQNNQNGQNDNNLLALFSGMAKKQGNNEGGMAPASGPSFSDNLLPMMMFQNVMAAGKNNDGSTGDKVRDMAGSAIPLILMGLQKYQQNKAAKNNGQAPVPGGGMQPMPGYGGTAPDGDGDENTVGRPNILQQAGMQPMPGYGNPSQAAGPNADGSTGGMDLATVMQMLGKGGMLA